MNDEVMMDWISQPRIQTLPPSIFARWTRQARGAGTKAGLGGWAWGGIQMGDTSACIRSRDRAVNQLGYPRLKVLLVFGRQSPVGITAVMRTNLDPDSEALPLLGSKKKD